MTGAGIPPVAVAAAAASLRAWLRLPAEGGEDVASFAAAALGVAEAFTRCALIARAHEDVVPASATWARLSTAPVRAIVGVTALPDGAAPFVLPVEHYGVDIDAGARGWIRVTGAGGAARVAVQYQAGLAAGWDALPPAVAQGAAMLIAHLFERGEERAPPAAVAALWRPHRRLHLGAEWRA